MAEHGRAAQGRDKRERAAQEGRAAEPGRSQIEQRAGAGAEQRGGLVHNSRHFRRVIEVDERRHEQRRGDNGQQLLERVDKIFPDRGLFVHIVDELHGISSVW